MKKDQKSWKYFLLRKAPLYIILIVIGFIAGLILVFYKNSFSPTSQAIQVLPDNQDCQILNTIRSQEYSLIKPLILFDSKIESDKLNPIKNEVLRFLDQKKHEGIISSAAVYLNELVDGSWMAINKDEQFSPGSLMKIPTLIVLLKESETNPSILERKIYFRKHFSQIPEQTLTAKPLEVGKYYSVRELLTFMIVDSDNDATALLNQTLNFNLMQKMFADFELPVPSITQQDYKIDIASCSRFLRVLFNATYLSKDNSEFALELLSKSGYKKGIVKDIDQSVKVAHKFGERNVDGTQQLHEFGIFFFANRPYLLGVMTKGSNNAMLPEILSGVSSLIYKSMMPPSIIKS